VTPFDAPCPGCAAIVRWVATLTHPSPYRAQVPQYRIECEPCDERDRRAWRVAS
jgi:C4-type Zn-finger protein